MVDTFFQIRTLEHGVIRVEKWPEGIVFWAGGEIAWRSWGPKPYAFGQPEPDHAIRLARAHWLLKALLDQWDDDATVDTKIIAAARAELDNNSGDNRDVVAW